MSAHPLEREACLCGGDHAYADCPLLAGPAEYAPAEADHFPLRLSPLPCTDERCDGSGGWWDESVPPRWVECACEAGP